MKNRFVGGRAALRLEVLENVRRSYLDSVARVNGPGVTARVRTLVIARCDCRAIYLLEE
jgi:hypothetical protein